MRSLNTLIILSMLAAAVFAQTEVSLPMPGYRIAAAGSLVEAAGGGLIVGKLDSLPRDRRAARFGVLLPSAGPVLEIQDGVTGVTLASVSAAQWMGRESAGWKRLADRSDASDVRRVDAFALKQGATSLTVVRTIERIEAPHLPLGVGIRIAIGIADVSVPSVRVVFRGTLEGAAVVNGSLLTIASAEKRVLLNATLMTLWSGGASLRLEGPAASRTLVVRSGALAASSSTVVPAFETTVAGTTSPVGEHQAAQSTAWNDHAKGQPARPLLVARTIVDRPKAAPGDTVQYIFTYYNVGTAPAADVELANPVPDGTRFLESSAAGFNSEIVETREPAEANVSGRVRQLTWKYKGAIAPGSSRWASFKVIVE